ncbi:MAG: heparinase II/III domain-containing protein [Verrucomicrobiia bacterium]
MKKCGLIFNLGCILLGVSIYVAETAENLPSHPRILFTEKDVSEIKAKIATQGWASNYFKNLKSNADNWLKREVALPNRGGQWYHYYSCPEHGARLRTESPTRHLCPVDGKVYSGYPYDDVVIMSEHNGYANALKTLGIVYQLTGESKYSDKGRQVLMAYAEKYKSYPLHTIRNEEKIGGGKVGPQTLDESVWLITMIEGADCIWNNLSAEEKNRVIEGLIKPAIAIIRQHKMGIHNIQCWKNSAVGLAGLLIDDMELVKEAINGESGYFNQMKKGVKTDGFWYEGAWGYHFYTISAVVHLTEGAFHCGINLYGEELKKMFDAPITMAMPDLELPAFNDSYSVELPSQSSLYEIALARYTNNLYRLVIESAGTRANLNALFYGEEFHGARPVFAISSTNFPASGYAILSSGRGAQATWLCIDYGPHGGGHGHPDKLGFVLYSRGEILAIDPGTANYGVPIQANWYRTTIAHNTLTVNETSQLPAEGKCLAFVSEKDFSAALCYAGQIYTNVSFHRIVALYGNDLIVAIDIIESNTTNVYDIAYHQSGKLLAEIGKPVEKLSDKPGYSQLRSLRSLTTANGIALNFKTPKGNDVGWMMVAGEPTQYITGSGIGKHTEDRVPIVIARRIATGTIFAWAVTIGAEIKPDPNLLQIYPMPNGKLAAVKIKYGGKTRLLVANPYNEKYFINNVSYQNRIADFIVEENKYSLLHFK